MAPYSGTYRFSSASAYPSGMVLAEASKGMCSFSRNKTSKGRVWTWKAGIPEGRHRRLTEKKNQSNPLLADHQVKKRK